MPYIIRPRGGASVPPVLSPSALALGHSFNNSLSKISALCPPSVPELEVTVDLTTMDDPQG